MTGRKLFALFGCLCAVLGMASDVSAVQSAVNPFKDAKVVWHMKTLEASENYQPPLKVDGRAQVGRKLDPEEYAQSLKRGGDGFATVLNEGGRLSLDLNRAKTLRPEGDAVSLYARVWVGPDGNGTLFFSDFMALAVHPKGLAIGFLGVRTPHGKVFRELPLGTLDRGDWLDLVVRVGDGKLDFFCNGVLKSSIPINQELCSPFDNVLQIGAFMWSAPFPLYEYKISGFHDGKIDTVALWGHALPDNQVAFLSGVERVRTPGVEPDGSRHPGLQRIL